MLHILHQLQKYQNFSFNYNQDVWYLKFLLCFVDGVLFSVDFDFEVFHALLVGLGDCALMVTQNSHSSVGTIVRQDLGGKCH